MTITMTFLDPREYRPTITAGRQEELSLRGISWVLRGAAAPSWAGAAADSCRGRLVKENVKRRVMQVDGWFVKQSVYRGLRGLLKRFAGGAARREAELCRRLAERGVAVPEVVAWGEERRGGRLIRDLLVTREVAGGVNLDRFLETRFALLAPGQRRALVARFAAFVRDLHDRGVLHHDLHLGNILIDEHRAGGGFVLLDADCIRLKPQPLDHRQRAANLAVLYNSVRARTSRAQRCRFLRDYGARFDTAGRALLREIAARHRALAQRVWRTKTVRSLRTNSRFVAEVAQGFRVWRKRERLGQETLAALLADPDGILERGTIVKAGNTVRAGIITIDGKRYFLKRYNVKGPWYRLRNAFRKSRAVRTWQNFWAFHVRNLPVPEPLACFEERRCRLLGRSYLLSEYVAGARTLADAWPAFDPGRQRSALIKAALLIGEMHRTGCLHGDLKWNNFLVFDDPGARFVIIDLDGARIAPAAGPRACLKDLERFLRDLRQAEGGPHWEALFLRVWGRASGSSRDDRFSGVCTGD